MLLGAFSWDEFCGQQSGVLGILQVVGYGLLIFKVAIPFIIIFLGMLDFGKAVTAEKPEEIKASAKRLLYRAIAGILIFFIPNIVVWVFGAIVNLKGESKFINCQNCLLHPMSSCEPGELSNVD